MVQRLNLANKYGTLKLGEKYAAVDASASDPEPLRRCEGAKGSAHPTATWGMCLTCLSAKVAVSRG